VIVAHLIQPVSGVPPLTVISTPQPESVSTEAIFTTEEAMFTTLSC
jgi:hypothetical protein